MIVFKTFFKVFKQYTFLCFMYLGIAIATIFILSNTGSSGSSSYTSTSQGIAVLDKDGSDISKGLIEYLSSINTIMDANDYNDDQIVDFMYYTKISNYLVIPEGFGENFKARALSSDNAAEIMLESTKNAGARMGYSVETEIDSYLNLFSGYIKGGFDVAAAQKLTVDSLSDKSSVNMVSEVKDDNTKIFTIFALLPYAIMTMLLSAVLHVLLRFGSSILRKRSGVSSMPVTNRMIMLALAAGIVTIAGISILIGIASGLSGEAFTARWVFVVMDVVVFSLTIVMIVVALSNMNIDPDATNALTNVISLSFSFLGGIFVPLEYLGGAAKAIGQFLPTYWYSECLTRIKEGKDFKEILNCLLIQILFGVMVMGVGLVVGKYRDRKTAK